MIPTCWEQDHRLCATARAGDPVVQRYRAFFAYLDGTVILER